MNERGEKLQKVLAQAGLGSRRAMEEWIAAGRVKVNGELATLGMRVIEGDRVQADRRSIMVSTQNSDIRVLLYHKPEGEIVSRDDPGKRASVFEKLPKLRGQKWIAIGRLDFNTSGLLIFTTSGDLANQMMHPKFELEREYAVRVQGVLSAEKISHTLNKGIALEDGLVKFALLEDQGGEGFNHWYRVMLKEGRNRVVRRAFDEMGFPVSRLIRVRFGIIGLPPRLKRGMTTELDPGEVKKLLDWISLSADEPARTPAPREVRTAGQSNRSQNESVPASPRGSISGRNGSERSWKSKTGIKR